MEEALFDTAIYREFAGLDAHGRMPDESTIRRFRHRLEKHKLAEQILATVNELLAAQGLLLKAGTAVDATLIAALSSTKNKDRKRDPEMHSSQKDNEWHFGMKAHIVVDADSGLVHTVIGTSGNVADVVEGNSSRYGQETDGFGGAGYQGVHKRLDAKEGVRWHIAAMRPSKRRALDKGNNPVDALIDQVEKIKARIRAKVEHPFKGKWLNRVVQGYFNYHAVPGNLYRLAGMRSEICRAWRHALMRRSQRHRLPWDRFSRIANRFIPTARNTHPHPEERFFASHT